MEASAQQACDGDSDCEALCLTEQIQGTLNARRQDRTLRQWEWRQAQKAPPFCPLKASAFGIIPIIIRIISLLFTKYCTFPCIRHPCVRGNRFFSSPTLRNPLNWSLLCKKVIPKFWSNHFRQKDHRRHGKIRYLQYQAPFRALQTLLPPHLNPSRQMLL